MLVIYFMLVVYFMLAIYFMLAFEPQTISPPLFLEYLCLSSYSIKVKVSCSEINSFVNFMNKSR
jgi:hypothetical protein